MNKMIRINELYKNGSEFIKLLNESNNFILN